MSVKKTTKVEEEAVKSLVSKENKYRDERGVRKQVYRRFKADIDYTKINPTEMTELMDSVIDSLGKQLHEGKVGQPRKYETAEEYILAAMAYFTYLKEANVNNLNLIPDIEGFCSYLGISRDSMLDWERMRDPRYIQAIKEVKNHIANCKKQLALHGKIPPLVFATDFNNNHGYTQKQEVILTPNNPLGDAKSPEEIQKRLSEGVVDDDE